MPINELDETRALITLEEARLYCLRNANDRSRDEILIEAVNDISASIWDHLEREPKPTTVPARKGTDGVTNGTTTFVAASGAFTSADVGKAIYITSRGLYTIASVTNATTVVLSGSPTAGTGLAWDFGEARVFEYDGSGVLDLRPYDLRELHAVTLYTDLETAQQDLLEAAEYRLRPAGRALGGTYLSIGVPTPNVAEYEYGYGWQVTVIGQWGMASTPAAIKFACKQWAKNIVDNPGSYPSHSMAGYTVTSDVASFDTLRTGAGMPRAVERRLSRYRRPDRSPLQVVRFRHPDVGQPGVPYAGLPRAN